MLFRSVGRGRRIPGNGLRGRSAGPQQKQLIKRTLQEVRHSRASQSQAAIASQAARISHSAEPMHRQGDEGGSHLFRPENHCHALPGLEAGVEKHRVDRLRILDNGLR